MNPQSEPEICREALFLMALPHALKVAAVRGVVAYKTTAMASLDRDDVEQEAVVAVWRALPFFDPARSSLNTFVEHVVVNRVTSLVRGIYAGRRGLRLRETLDQHADTLSASPDHLDLRVDVRRVLAGLPPIDRFVAQSLMHHAVADTAGRLGISRARVYRAIGRLRVTLASAGLAPVRHQHRAGGTKA